MTIPIEPQPTAAEETQQVLAEMEAEGIKVDSPNAGEVPVKPKVVEPPKKPDEVPPPPVEPKKPVEPPKEQPPRTPRTEVKPKEGDKVEPPKPPRSVKMVPAWQYEMEKKRTEKLEADLKAARDGKPPVPTVAEPPKPESTPLVSEEKKKKLADRLGLELGDINELVSLAAEGIKQDIPKEILDAVGKVKTLEDWKQKQESNFNETHEYTEFGKEFESDVLPLVRAEYPGATQEELMAVLKTVREEMKVLAFTEEYAKLSLVKIFKAEDQLHGLITPKAKTGEAGAGGANRGGDVIDYDNVTDDQIANFTEDELLAYEQHQLKKEGNPRAANR